MINYLKMPIYFFLTILEGFMNFMCSIFAYYPAFDFSTGFLVHGELIRVRREVAGRVTSRQELNIEADQKVSLAKQLDGSLDKEGGN